MVRDLRRLADSRFDLVVVGAGFYGALAAWDATLRGLAVGIIDQGDFGGGTSFNNLKTLHGGLRSLQSLDLPQMRRFIRERRALARVAPHLVRPLPFVVPTYRQPTRSATLMRLALRVNDAIAWDRHAGLGDPGLRLPPGRVVSRTDCLELNPLIDPRGVTGGAVWYDYHVHNTDRMTLAFILSAADRGAAAANYLKATRLIRDGARVAGVHVVDQLSGDAFDIGSAAVVNAAGPWAAAWLQAMGLAPGTPAPRLSRAMNLVTRGVTPSHACGGLARGRFLFAVPWRNVSLFGTSHDTHVGAPDDLTVTARDVEALLADIERAFPRAALAAGDVRLVHRGLLPMVAGEGDRVQLLRESAVVDHRAHGAAGLVSMFGVRYTTARDTAARAVDAVFRHRGHPTPPRSPTAETAVAGGDIPHTDQFIATLLARHADEASAETLRRLGLTYGTRYLALLDLIRQDPALAATLGRHCAVTGSEIVHAARAESAMRLGDALIRRTEAGSAGHPGPDAVERAAQLLQRELGWTDARRAQEIADVDAFYRLPG